MRVLEWVLAVIAALAMLGAALNKLFSTEFRTDLADSINMPGWFLVLVALLQLTIVLDLLWPRLRVIGGLLMFVTMIGAVIFNIFGQQAGDIDPTAAIPLNIVLALLGLAPAWLAAGRPTSLGPFLAQARDQALGQVEAVTDAVT